MNTPKVSVRPRASKRPTDSYGVSLAGPPLVPWQSVRVWWLGAGQAGAECTDEETIAALREYRRTGGMHLRVLADPADYDSEGEPRDGEGPNLTDAGPAVAEIDWAGFPEAEDDCPPTLANGGAR